MAAVALLAVIVLGDSIRQWYGYVILKRPFTSSEVVVMAGGERRDDCRRRFVRMKQSECSCPAGAAANY